MFPVYHLVDGACHIGLPTKVSVPLMAYDVAINIALTGLFVHFLRPTMRFRFMMRQERLHAPEPPTATDLPRHISRAVEITTRVSEGRLSTSTESNPKEPYTSTVSIGTPSGSNHIVGWAHPSTRFHERHNSRMEVLLKKSMIGAFIVLMPTVANMILFVVVNGTEQSWLCFTLCSLDGPLHCFRRSMV